MSKHFACLAVVGLAAIVLSSPAQTAPIYHLTDLGTLGGTVSVPTGINDVGQIVGYSLTAGGEYRATLFDSSGGGANRHLGTLGGNTSVASAINNAGQIVGSADGPDNHARATLFDSSGGGANRDLGTVDNAPFSNARSVNNAGQIVGDAFSGGGIAVLFDPAGGGANRILGRGRFVQVLDINNNGQIVGSVAESRTDPVSAILFDPSGGGANRALGRVGSTANSINDAGQIVGGETLAEGGFHATLFDSNSGANRDLGTLGGLGSEAFAINNTGQIVGSASTSEGERHAFLFDDEMMSDLNSLISPTDPLLDNVLLLDALSINNAGQIVATGIPVEEAGSRAFLLTPVTATVAVPEPATLSMIVAGIISLVLLIRQRSIQL